MAPTKTASSGEKYSVILPTFNERKNLPIVAWLLNRTFTEQYAPEIPCPTLPLKAPSLLICALSV